MSGPQRHPLSELAEAEQSPLDEAARSRIKGLIRQQGPQVVARAHTVRKVRLVAQAVVPVLLVVGAVGWWTRNPPRDCESFGSEVGTFAQKDGGPQVLELARARLVASPDARIKVQALESCRLWVQLEQGRVHVHARELGGGELKIEAPGGAARVYGTIFAVEQAGDRFSVEVAEGLVEVSPKQKAATRLSRGQVYRQGKVGALTPPELEPLLEVEQSDRWPLTGAGAEVAAPDGAVAPGSLAEAEPEDVEDESIAPVLEDRAAAPEVDRTRVRRSRAERRAAALAERRAKKAALAAEAEAEAEAKADAQKAEQEAEEEAPAQPALNPGPGPSGRTLGQGSGARGAAEENAEVWVARADACRRAGDPDCARTAYKKAGRLSGPTAEAAWLALARMELSLGRGEAARDALQARKLNFSQGQLDVEASWLLVRAHAEAGDDESATLEARRLVSRWPNTPQATAANKWLKEHGGP
jgi:tetratricopeptide (TPR) repeat protein